MMCKALSKKFGYNLVIIRSADIKSKWLGQSEQALNKVIEFAKKNTPCILVIVILKYCLTYHKILMQYIIQASSKYLYRAVLYCKVLFLVWFSKNVYLWVMLKVLWYKMHNRYITIKFVWISKYRKSLYSAIIVSKNSLQ